jgi:long chain fatty acid CoA FadD26
VTARFDAEKLAAGHAERCGAEPGTELVGHGSPGSSTMRIVDPETGAEAPAGKVGEIWVHGDNIASGYWRNPERTASTFGARLDNPSPGTPQGPWLRTGDLAVMSQRELFIIGRIKDLLIVDGRNHYPEDIEATVQGITGGRVAAVSIINDDTERLVVIAELKLSGRDGAGEAVSDRLRAVSREVTSAVSLSHGLLLSDLVLAAPGSLPLTTSGKVRRSMSAEWYQRGKFERLEGAHRLTDPHQLRDTV